MTMIIQRRYLFWLYKNRRWCSSLSLFKETRWRPGYSSAGQRGAALHASGYRLKSFNMECNSKTELIWRQNIISRHNYFHRHTVMPGIYSEININWNYYKLHKGIRFQKLCVIKIFTRSSICGKIRESLIANKEVRRSWSSPMLITHGVSCPELSDQLPFWNVIHAFSKLWTKLTELPNHQPICNVVTAWFHPVWEVIPH